MKKIRSLSAYAKFMLIVLAAMLLVFSILYPICLSRTGFAYRGAILRQTEKDGVTVYSGKVQGKETVFNVYSDRSVEYRRGSASFGPYTVRETPEAVAEELTGDPDIIGVELRTGSRIVFRGAMLNHSLPGRWLYNTDGTDFSVPVFPNTENQDGSSLNAEEPLPAIVLDLMYGPRLTHNGQAVCWFAGAALCLLTALLILFADRLFRWDLQFIIRDPEGAEPSEWMYARWYFNWTLLAACALFVFIYGLNQHAVAGG